MNYLTQYYKNLSEELQAQVNYLQNLLIEEDGKSNTKVTTVRHGYLPPWNDAEWQRRGFTGRHTVSNSDRKKAPVRWMTTSEGDVPIWADQLPPGVEGTIQYGPPNPDQRDPVTDEALGQDVLADEKIAIGDATAKRMNTTPEKLLQTSPYFKKEFGWAYDYRNQRNKK